METYLIFKRIVGVGTEEVQNGEIIEAVNDHDAIQKVTNGADLRCTGAVRYQDNFHRSYTVIPEVGPEVHYFTIPVGGY